MCRRWLVRKQSPSSMGPYQRLRYSFPCVISNPPPPRSASVLLSCPVRLGYKPPPMEYRSPLGRSCTCAYMAAPSLAVTQGALAGEHQNPQPGPGLHVPCVFGALEPQPLSITLTLQISLAQPSIAKSTWTISSSATKLGVCLPQSSMRNAQKARPMPKKQEAIHSLAI